MIAGSLLLCVFVRAGPSCLVRHYAVTTFNGTWTRESLVSCLDRSRTFFIFILELSVIAVAPVQRGWSMLHIIVFEYSQKRTRCRMSPCSNRDCTFRLSFLLYIDSCPAYISIRRWRLADFETLSLRVYRGSTDISVQPEPKRGNSISKICGKKERGLDESSV